MRFAYADPPYPGCAHRYAGGVEVDHAVLVAHLVTFDGWALSTSSTALRDVLPLCPVGVRVMAWVKPFAAYKRNVSPAYAWEPVIVSPARKAEPGLVDQQARDWIAESITMKKGLTGAKPPHFCEWLFFMLGARPGHGDTLADLFPGTGAVSRAWEKFSAGEKMPAREFHNRVATKGRDPLVVEVRNPLAKVQA